MISDKKTMNRLQSIDPSVLMKKFKDHKTFLKRFMEEDGLIKQGLVKTN